MAFTPLNSSMIAAGKPTRQELFTVTKDNFDDHETRITSLEGSIGQSIPIDFSITGEVSQGYVMDGLLHHRVHQNITVLGVRLVTMDAGSAGTIEIDVKYKRGANPFATILTSNITQVFSAGDYAVSSGVIAVPSLLLGDILRLDVVSVQTGAREVHVYIENVPA